MTDWGFLTNHGRALLYLAYHPDARLRELADALEVTERTAYAIVGDLAGASYVVKQRHGRRNRYLIPDDLPFRDRIGRESTAGELRSLLDKFTGQLPR